MGDTKQILLLCVIFFFHHLSGLEPLNGRKSKEMEKYGNKKGLKQNSTNAENLRDHLLNLKRPL